MTREEAIRLLSGLMFKGKLKEALDMAIKALEQEPCEDCISRDAVIKHICEYKECYKDECKGRLYKRCWDIQWVYDLPSVTPIHRDRTVQDFDDKCRECGREKVFDKIKAEIEMYEADCRLQGGTDECEECNSNVFGSIYRIIDKYKAESEEINDRY